MKKTWMGLMVGGLLFAQIGCSEEAPVTPPAADPGALMEKSKEAVKEAGEEAAATVEEVGEKAGAAIEEVGEKAGAAIEEAGEKAGAAVEGAKEAVKDAAP